MGRCLPSCSRRDVAGRRACPPRRQAVKRARAEFDHANEVWHGAQLYLGAANMLCLVLTKTSEREDEIRGTCVALEMVYCARREAVMESYQEEGAALVPLLLRLLERCKISCQQG